MSAFCARLHNLGISPLQNPFFVLHHVISAANPQQYSLSKKSIPCKSHINCDTVSRPNVSRLHVFDRKCILYVTHIFVEISSIRGTSLPAWQPPGDKPCWDWSPHPVLHVRFIPAPCYTYITSLNRHKWAANTSLPCMLHLHFTV